MTPKLTLAEVVRQEREGAEAFPGDDWSQCYVNALNALLILAEALPGDDIRSLLAISRALAALRGEE